jgi:hypothetical protein
MFAKKIFLTFTLTILLAAVVPAQTNERTARWKKYFSRSAKVLNVVPVNTETPDQSEWRQDDAMAVQPNAAAKGRLEGTWIATVTFTDGFELKVFFTFMAGKDENEGTLIDTNEFLLTPNPIGAPDQGVWQRTADRSFIATHLAFLFDADAGSEPAGTAKVRDSITINDLGTQFTGRQYVEIFDASGKLVDTFQATMRATRMRAEAPPAQ